MNLAETLNYHTLNIMETPHKELFIEVVESNISRVKNSINNKAFDYSVLTHTQHLSNDEIRTLAVAFFTKTLTDELKDYTDGLMFKVLHK